MRASSLSFRRSAEPGTTLNLPRPDAIQKALFSMSEPFSKILIMVLVIPLAWNTSASCLRAQTFAAPLQATGSNSVDFGFRWHDD